VDRQKLVALAHADHPISAPVSDSRVDDLLGRTIRRPDAHVLDLGCGEGAWLLRALQAYPGITAVGVDISKERFDHTLESAARLGIADRLELIQQDVKQYRSSRPADGVLLLGDCFWEREPDPALLAEMEDKGPQKFTDLPTLVDNVVADGWTPVFGHVSTQTEWDDYEWSWTGALAGWALDHPDHPDREHVLRVSAEHRHGWLHGHRGVLGFVLLLLRR
jgi:SAM-dependent methyltransferase